MNGLVINQSEIINWAKLWGSYLDLDLKGLEVIILRDLQLLLISFILAPWAAAWSTNWVQALELMVTRGRQLMPLCGEGLPGETLADQKLEWILLWHIVIKGLSWVIPGAELWGGIFSTSSLPELFNLSTVPLTSTSWAVYYFCLLTKREYWLLTQPLLASELSNMIQRFSPLKSRWFNMAQIGNDLKLCWPDSCLEAHLKWTISQFASRQGTCYC